MQPQMPKRPNKLITTNLIARQGLLEGCRKLYEAVSSTYGAMSGNVVLQKPFGDPVITHDGVTVARDIFLRDDIENLGAVILKQASDQTNKQAGDGTTATVVLGYHLLEAAHRRVVAGESAMAIKRALEKDARKVMEFVKSKSEKANSEKLVQVATISSGDEEVGKLIADVVEEVGDSGAITMQENLLPGIKVEKIGGYYFEKGFFALNKVVEYTSPHVIVTQKKLVSAFDVLPIIKLAQQSGNRRVILIGDVSGDALNTAIGNIINGQWECCIIPPPAYGDDSKLFLEDIALYTAAKLFYEGDRLDKMTSDDFGSVERSQVSQERAILFNRKTDEAVDARVKEIQKVLEDEDKPHKKEKLEERIAKLTGKVTIVKVGGSTQAEMEELKFRVEDAIEATKSAFSDGVLPGNATVLLFASELEVHPLLKEALQSPFLTLMENAGESGTYRMKQVLKAGFGHGFNVREMSEEPQLLSELGVLDATKAIAQTVQNAVSAANVLLTSNATVTMDEDPVEPPKQ